MNSRHNARMTVFAVEYTYDARTDLRDEVRPEHRRYLSGLHVAGTLLASGPYTAPAEGLGEQPDGALLLFRADDVDHLLRLLDEDPFRLHGIVAARTVRPWLPVFGPWT